MEINSDMTISDIINSVPEAQDILAEFQLGCAGCVMGGYETLQQGAMMHGLSNDEVQEIVDEINRVSNAPRKTIEIEGITFTENAFDKVLEFIRNDKRKNLGLLIQIKKDKDKEIPYFFDLTTKKEKQEKEIDHTSLKIFINEKDHKAFKKLLIDYRMNSQEEGFKITEKET